ncbi:MAG: GNAT family N-acetyltransferase [Oscillatoriales cyanobacterium SM2_2_1]|nr:GNAT family N-acetyltransferase [Oscillatoriales cyanobacterium SM2_2_1]
MNIKKAVPQDASKVLDLLQKLDGETKFMLFESGERKTTLTEQEKIIGEIDNVVIFCALDNEDFIGIVIGYRGKFKRKRHSLYIVIGVLKTFWGNGVGRSLIKVIEKWSVNNDCHRLELTVVTHNERAVRLYHKLGFLIEGVRQHSLLVDDCYFDEYYMSKLVAQSAT